MHCKKNKLDWVHVKKVMYQTSNKGQRCQQLKLRESYEKTWSKYKPPIKDPNGQSK